MTALRKKFPTSGIKLSSHKDHREALIQIMVINQKRKRVSIREAKIIKEEKRRKKKKRKENKMHAIVRLIAVFSDLFKIV